MAELHAHPFTGQQDKPLCVARTQGNLQLNFESLLDPSLECSPFVAAIRENLRQTGPEWFRDFQEQLFSAGAFPNMGGIPPALVNPGATMEGQTGYSRGGQEAFEV